MMMMCVCVMLWTSVRSDHPRSPADSIPDSPEGPHQEARPESVGHHFSDICAGNHDASLTTKGEGNGDCYRINQNNTKKLDLTRFDHFQHEESILRQILFARHADFCAPGCNFRTKPYGPGYQDLTMPMHNNDGKRRLCFGTKTEDFP